jgi:hypothetical protein
MLPPMGEEQDVSIELLPSNLSGGLSSFQLELASGPETLPKRYLRVIRLVPNPLDGVLGLDASLRWDIVMNRSWGLGYILRYLGSQPKLGPSMGVPIVIPDYVLWGSYGALPRGQTSKL